MEILTSLLIWIFVLQGAEGVVSAEYCRGVFGSIVEGGLTPLGGGTNTVPLRGQTGPWKVSSETLAVDKNTNLIHSIFRIYLGIKHVLKRI